MRGSRTGWIFILGLVVTSAGAAPSAPSYVGVERAISDIRDTWTKAGAAPQPNAPGWNTYFDELLSELRAYSAATNENDRLVALGQSYQKAVQLWPVKWAPAVRLREELRAWLRPRVRLAWAERRLIEGLGRSSAAPDANRDRWMEFVNDDIGVPLRLLDGTGTVAQRLDGLKRLYGALHSLETTNQSIRWGLSRELQLALNDLYNQPNLDISADVATLAPVLSHDVVITGPIYRKGYVSQVTAGPKTGFGLMWSNEGIAFYNKQMATSITPITDFQNQIASDRRGRRAAKMYYFTATSRDDSEITIVATLTPSGLTLGPQYAHSVNAFIGSLKQPGQGFGRFIASLLGQNQATITQKVYDGAIGKLRTSVVQEAAELGGQKTAEAAAEQNAKLAQFLIGGDALAFRNLIINNLTLRSRPENALVGGTLHWLGAAQQVGADSPQPTHLAVPDAGVSADFHLSSILTSLVRGYLQTDDVKAINNLMIVTRKIGPNDPPKDAVAVSRNADYPTYLKAIETTREANDPKVLAIRVKRPTRAPEFGADARGFLVALVNDFQLEVPAPPQAAKGGLSGAPARVYRITSPRAEFVISFKISPKTESTPVRLSGRVEGFDPGPEAKVYAINEDENRAESLTAFTSAFVLGVMRTKLQGQPIDVPLSNLELKGFAIRDVSTLDPTGWIRVNLVRTSSSPAAGVQ